MFENIFKEKYPSVHHVSIMTENGESKGYGFIQFINKYDYEINAIKFGEENDTEYIFYCFQQEI